VVVIFRTFIATPVRVDGDSMNDTLHNNDILILNKLEKNYDRFDIVVINYNNTKLVKRIIGLPGENISYKDNQLYIMQEAKVHNLIYKLYIEVKPYFAKEDNTAREKTEINKEESDNFDLDDISLNLPEDKKNRNPSENEVLLLSNVHGAKLINNDEDIQNFDVIIDGNEKNICEDCMNNNDCFIF
jgi:signal peptidase I